jgi:hypothetical protein
MFGGSRPSSPLRCVVDREVHCRGDRDRKKTRPDTPDMPKTANFLRFFLNETPSAGSGGRGHSRKPSVLSSKVLLTLHFYRECPSVTGCGHGLLSGLMRWGATATRWRFGPQNRGVGFAIVGRRGYGRRRWPD